ncbi:hypothetical protein Tco_1313243 [Tanacetum coccineum]
MAEEQGTTGGTKEKGRLKIEGECAWKGVLLLQNMQKGCRDLNQGTLKLTSIEGSCTIEDVKLEFEKLVKQLDTYVPMNFEATKESLKRFGEELQTKTAKKLKFDDEGTQPTDEKIEEDKDDISPTQKTGKRRKR